MVRGALAEQPSQKQITERPHLYAVPDRLEVRAARETGFEAEAVEEFEEWLGSRAVQAVEAAETGEDFAKVNFLERLQAAKAGNEQASRWIDINIATAASEGVFKEHVGATYMDRTDEGKLAQFGQTNDDIHHNALSRPDRHSILKDITRAEALNKHRIEAAAGAGELKDDWYVVFSLVPEDVPAEDLGPNGDGYFLDELTLNIQATTQIPDGRIKVETAFTAGVEAEADDSFEDRLAKRHDFLAVRKLYEWLGKKAPDTAGELLKDGLFISKDKLPHGVVQLKYWLDLAKDEVLGHKVERKLEDYLGLWLESRRREASLKEVRQNVREDLFSVADHLKTPMEGVDRLWEFVKARATEDSFTNEYIDPKVFGRAAAGSIKRARHHLRSGNVQAAQKYRMQALLESEISGCGGGAGGSKSARPEGAEDLSHIAGTDNYGSRAFRCSEGHLNIRWRPNEKVHECQHAGCDGSVAC